MILLPLIFAIASTPQQGYVEQHARIQEQIERRYSELAKACLRHDMSEVMNYMTFDVTWTEKHGKDTKEVDRTEIVQRLSPWVESLDPKGVLRFHVNRMYIADDDHVQTEVETQYAPSGQPFPPKVKKEDRVIWKEDLVKVSMRWMLKHAEQISPKSNP